MITEAKIVESSVTGPPQADDHPTTERIRVVHIPTPAQFFEMSEAIMDENDPEPSTFAVIRTFFTQVAEAPDDHPARRMVRQAWNCLTWNMAKELGGEMLQNSFKARAGREPTRYEKETQDRALMQHHDVIQAIQKQQSPRSEPTPAHVVTGDLCYALGVLDIRPGQTAFTADLVNSDINAPNSKLIRHAMQLELHTSPRQLAIFWHQCKGENISTDIVSGTISLN